MLAVDVGNTKICFCRFVEGRLTWQAYLPTAEINFEYINQAVTESGATKVLVSSVVRPVNNFFLKGVPEAGCDFVRIVTPAECEIIPNKLSTPETTGSDRLFSALAATAMFPDESLVVVQAGTAITVDAITKEGVFLGGYIMPGTGMWLDSMTSAAHLPHFLAEDIDWGVKGPGNCTKDAMLGGAGVGLKGAVKEAVRTLAITLGGSPRLIFTGGWAEKLRGILPGEVCQFMVCKGIEVYARREGII